MLQRDSLRLAPYRHFSHSHTRTLTHARTHARTHTHTINYIVKLWRSGQNWGRLCSGEIEELTYLWLCSGSGCHCVAVKQRDIACVAIGWTASRCWHGYGGYGLSKTTHTLTHTHSVVMTAVPCIFCQREVILMTTFSCVWRRCYNISTSWWDPQMDSITSFKLNIFITPNFHRHPKM